MALTLETPPAVEPISAGDVKSHLQIDGDDLDTRINALIPVARNKVENFIHRPLITQTWNWTLDEFPHKSIIDVPKPKLQSVVSIVYIDPAGVQQTLGSSKYIVDNLSFPGRIERIGGESWPSTDDRVNAVTIQFIAGFGDASAVPDDLKHAILLIIGHYLENREDSSLLTVKKIPFGAETLMWAHVFRKF